MLKEKSAAALVVTHDPSEAMRIADRIALMRSGRIVQVGSPDELYNHPVDAGAASFFSDHATVEGLVQDGAVDTKLGRFVAPKLANGTRAQALLRPEAVEIVASGGVAGRVARWRLVGATGLADLDVDGVALTSRTSAQPLSSGQTVQIRIVPERVLVFAQSGP
jgi:iron(III) transport system ATP-binding protein